MIITNERSHPRFVVGKILDDGFWKHHREFIFKTLGIGARYPERHQVRGVRKNGGRCLAAEAVDRLSSDRNGKIEFPGFRKDGFEIAKQSEPLFQKHLYGLAHVLANRFPDLRFDWQHVPSVTHCHERTSKRMAVDLAADFNQSMCLKELHRARPDNVGPTAFVRAFFQLGRE